MSARKRQSAGDMIPGTAVSMPHRTAERVLAATTRPAPAVPDQGDLVEHWHECGLLTEQQLVELGGDAA